MRRSIQAGSSARHRASPARNDVPPGLQGHSRSQSVIVGRRFSGLTRPAVPIALTRSLQDYAGMEADQPEEVETLVQLDGPSHYRMLVRKPYGTGHAEFCGIADGFFVNIGDIDVDQPYPMSVSAPEMLRVRIASEGDGEYVTAQGEVLDIHGPGAAIIVEPAAMRPAEGVFVGRNRAVHVYVHGKALKTLFEDSERQLPAVLQAFLAGTLQRTVARRLPLTPGLLRCLEELHGLALEGRTRRLFIQSKAIEILCHAFDALAQEDGLGSAEASALAARGVLKAQRLLMANFVAPPSLEELAHEVGMSRSGLCAAFRQILGQTVFDYIADLRMQRALALLSRRDASITQIAYDVGYNHLSSFSVAVQRRFGATPSELRRRGLPTL